MDKNVFFELILLVIFDINILQLLVLSMENLIEDELQLIIKIIGNLFIFFFILSYGLKQFVYDVQDGQQINYGNKYVIQMIMVFCQRWCFMDGIYW